VATDLLYLRDAYQDEFDAVVTAVRAADASGDAPVCAAVSLDRTALYATGGGQPHDTGTLAWEGGAAAVTSVRKDGEHVWHELDGEPPEVGALVHGTVDWERRHQLMRTHTALHVMGGVIWNEWRVPATGGNMDPLSARMDFEFGPLPEGFAARLEEAVNAELAADRPIEVAFLPRSALETDDIIRTKVSLVPDGVDEIRVVDIVGLDKQADGGTHVRSTAEVGRVRILKTESKGKGNKRVRLAIEDAS
jgi:misacylated tRNA(Ala) deacylase